MESRVSHSFARPPPFGSRRRRRKSAARAGRRRPARRRERRGASRCGTTTHQEVAELVHADLAAAVSVEQREDPLDHRVAQHGRGQLHVLAQHEAHLVELERARAVLVVRAEELHDIVPAAAVRRRVHLGNTTRVEDRVIYSCVHFCYWSSITSAFRDERADVDVGIGTRPAGRDPPPPPPAARTEPNARGGARVNSSRMRGMPKRRGGARYSTTQ